MKIHVEFDIEFRKNPYKGKYFAIEGIDGSGKSTQVKKVSSILKEKGYNIVITSEPRYDSPVGAFIHSVLRGEIDVPSTAIQSLMDADRVDNHEKIVEKALDKGSIVISHRSFWSVIPYGVMDKGLFSYDAKKAHLLAVAHGLLSHYHQYIAPDMAFYLRVPVDIALERLSKMDKTKESYEKRDKMEQVMKGYEWQLKQYPQMFTVIDGEQSEEKITEQIVREILKQVQDDKKK